jgi:ribonuclease VapC
MTTRLISAVVDSSALMCIAKNEPASILFMREMTQAGALLMSAVTRSEALLVALATRGSVGVAAMETLISALRIVTANFGASDIESYKNAAAAYHIKARPPGTLNMGDLFAFQIAEKYDLPLFFQGMDFLSTPVKNAMAMRGYVMNAQNKGVPTAP